MATISPEAVTERRQQDDDDVLLLDIRDADAFAEWHMPGSTNIDVYETLKTQPTAAQAAFQDLPKDKEIVTICGVGIVSDTATDVLRDMGYEAKTLENGLKGWSRVHSVAPIPVDIAGQLLQVARPGTGCLSYILITGTKAVVIDPSQFHEKYEAIISEREAELSAVLETHAHADHISGARALANEHEVPYYLHSKDAGALETSTPIRDATELAIGDITVTVHHTPGHTPGSVTFDIANEILLTGDTLFLDSVGRPDLDGGSKTAIRRRAGTLYDSLQHLQEQPDELLIGPAHASGSPYPPMTETLKSVRERNALLDLSRAAFIEKLTNRIPETPPNHDQIKRVNVGEDTLEGADAEGIELGPNRCAAE